KITRSIAIILSLILSIILISGIIYFLSTQIANFSNNVADIQKNFESYIATSQKWVAQTFHLSIPKQKDYLDQLFSKLNKGKFIRGTFVTITQELVIIVLLPIYTFLFLYYRDKIKHFLITVFKKSNAKKTIQVLNQSRTMIENYMLGLLIEMVIIALLTSVGLLIVGVKFALFLGVLTAILNLIPYLGILAAAIFAIFVSLGTSQELGDLIWVSILYLVVHNIDSNILKTII